MRTDLSLLFVLGLLVHQSLTDPLKAIGAGPQKGNLFPAFGAGPVGPAFSNFGNVGAATLHKASNIAIGTGAFAGGNAGGFGKGLGFGGAQGLGGYGGGHGLGGGFGAAGPGVGGGYAAAKYGGALLGGLQGGYGAGRGGLGFNPGFGALGGGVFPGGPRPGGFGPARRQEEPLKLTCKRRGAVVKGGHGGYGARVASIAVTVELNRDAVSGGGYGGNSPHAFPLGGPKRALSLDLEIGIEGASGKAEVVFTKFGSADGSCDAKSLGGVFTGVTKDPFDAYFGSSIFGNYDNQDGVITTVSLYPDRTTTVHKDRLDIDSVQHLAGRGIAVVSSVKNAGYGGHMEIDGEVLACCSLAFDDKERSLVDPRLGDRPGGRHGGPGEPYDGGPHGGGHHGGPGPYDDGRYDGGKDFGGGGGGGRGVDRSVGYIGPHDITRTGGGGGGGGPRGGGPHGGPGPYDDGRYDGKNGFGGGGRGGGGGGRSVGSIGPHDITRTGGGGGGGCVGGGCGGAGGGPAYDPRTGGPAVYDPRSGGHGGRDPLRGPAPYDPRGQDHHDPNGGAPIY